MRRTARARSPAWAWLLLCAGLLAGCGGSDPGSGRPTGAGPDPRPDLLLVVVDTLRADHLSAYGYPRPTTPFLQQVGQQGTVFEDATAQSSWTLPSMASLFSGRHLFVNAQRLPATPSLAEQLAEAGYETVGFVGNPAVSRGGQYDRGFETWITRDDTGGETWTAPDLEDALTRFLAAHPPGERPRLYYLHYLDPHWPYEPRTAERLPGEVVLSDQTLAAWVTRVQASPEGDPLRTDADLDRRYVLEQIDNYDREVAETDASIARAVGAIDASRAPGRERLLVVASDHGEGLWDHEHHPGVVARLELPETPSIREVFFRDHSYHLYQELLHTPLIVSGPGFPAGARVAAPVENVDILPTLLRAAGVSAPPDLDGHALQDVITGEARRDFVFAHSNEGTAVRAVDSGWKLHWPTDTGFSFAMQAQLYRLADDPSERDDRKDTEVELYRNLLRIREQAAAAYRKARLFDEAGHLGDPAHTDVLEQFGYVDTGNPDTGNPDTGNPDAADPGAADPDAGRSDQRPPDGGEATPIDGR